MDAKTIKQRAGASPETVDIDGAKRMLNWFDKQLEAVDMLVAGDPWPRQITITVNTAGVCDFRSCLLKLIDLMEHPKTVYKTKKEDHSWNNAKEDPFCGAGW